MNKDKLVLPISILLGCIILGSFLYASQLSKQKSIEKQQMIKIEEDRKAIELKVEKEKMENEAKTILKNELIVCLNEADKSLENSFIALCRDDIRISGGDNKSCLNGELDDKISFMTASNLYDSLFRRILEKREKDRDNCYK